MKFNKPIGPNMPSELAAAGAPPLTWTSDGEVVNRDSLTAAQQTTVRNVFEAHVAAAPTAQLEDWASNLIDALLETGVITTARANNLRNHPKLRRLFQPPTVT